MAELRFTSVGNIGEGGPDAIPVRQIGASTGYYVYVLGFEVVERTETTAKLRRDDATIGLAVNGQDPEQASIYFGVNDVDALHRELTEKGIAPSPIRTDTHGGKTYRVTFAQEPFGVCFCFGQEVAAKTGA